MINSSPSASVSSDPAGGQCSVNDPDHDAGHKGQRSSFAEGMGSPGVSFAELFSADD